MSTTPRHPARGNGAASDRSHPTLAEHLEAEATSGNIFLLGHETTRHGLDGVVGLVVDRDRFDIDQPLEPGP